jgi:hypothetical protein
VAAKPFPAFATILAVALIAVTPCGTASPPVGRWTYRVADGPAPSGTIRLDGPAIVVSDFASDRAFTTTISRYDAKTLRLISVKQHASCCLTTWNASIVSDSNGAYLITTASGRKHLAGTREPIVVNAPELLPWLFHRTGAGSMVAISLPNISSNGVRVGSIGISEVSNETRPTGVPRFDRALRVTADSGGPTILWYDSCTFVVDAIVKSGSLALRNGL